MFIFGFARTMSFSLKLPERFSPIGFFPNKTQCALYAFDPESGESQQSWLSHIVKFWICLDLTLPGNPFKLKPEKSFAQILSQLALPRFPLLQRWSTFCAFASRADGNISWISHEGPEWNNLDVLLHPPFPQIQKRGVCVCQYWNTCLSRSCSHLPRVKPPKRWLSCSSTVTLLEPVACL